jgi:hypothetical protein
MLATLAELRAEGHRPSTLMEDVLTLVEAMRRQPIGLEHRGAAISALGAPVDRSTISVRSDLRERLALLKSGKSWDDFLSEIADQLPVDDAIIELERRLADLRRRRFQTGWSPSGHPEPTTRRRAHRAPVQSKQSHSSHD